VDVYSAWVDACEEVNKAKKLAAAKARNEANDGIRQEQGGHYDDDDEYDEDD
jgi:transcription elongation factor Elf1